jgi:hypothetical protein
MKIHKGKHTIFLTVPRRDTEAKQQKDRFNGRNYAQPTPSGVEENNGKCAGALDGILPVSICPKMLQDNRQGEVDLLSHVARHSEHEVKRVVGRGIRDMLNWNHATGKGSIMCRGKRRSLEESVTHF